MSHFKSSSINSNFSQSMNINQIRPDLRAEYEKNHLSHPTSIIFDPDLNHRQRMFLLYQSGAIENEFLHYIQDRIYTLNIPEDIRDSLFQNLHKLSANLIPIDMYSGTNQYYSIANDSDEDTNVDSLSDINSDDNDSYDDLQNRLLDRIAMEYDVAAFHAAEEQPYDNNQQDDPYN